jgi:excisionase family DNA binding protein
MGIDTDIRAIARDAAREVIREELKQIESSLEARRVSRPPAERLLSVEDVAGLCGVTTKTVQRWIARGLLRAIRSPGMREYRITQREYDAFTSGAAANGSTKADERDLEAEASRAVATALAPRRAGR